MRPSIALRPRRLLMALCMLYACSISAQTNISGIVNTYRSVIEIVPAKACIRVSNITGITVNTRILLVQMKGATINTANTASFGDTITTADAGFYEVGTICYIRGDSVFLFHNLINTYNTISGKVQLVQFAEYTSANVVDTLKASPWNESTGTGGVIALFADSDISLNAPIYADSSGYRGGAFVQSSGVCSNAVPATGYAYTGSNTGPQNGSYKGGSIADLAAAQTGGRGAPANGGGGGNNHNNSGGGGANAGAGGNGGGNSSTSGCSVTLRGLGGKPLKNWGEQKIFFGGGGGAGHNNNGLLTKGGGNGGGIIFIWANSLTGNNHHIRADGGAGGDSQSDGAGGGGGGGTIIMHVSNYITNANIHANGGAGGTSDDGGNIGRCYGGGGGGGGGAVYYTGALPAVTTSANGGAAGAEVARDASCAAAQPSAAGSNGLVLASYTFARSTATAGYCSLLLPTKLIYFKGAAQSRYIQLNWQLQNPELAAHFIIEKKSGTDWLAIKTVAASNATEYYTGADSNAIPGENYYRLKVTERSGVVYYSTVIRIVMNTGADLFTLYPNPARGSFFIYKTVAGAVLITITDISGKVILQQTIRARRQEVYLPEAAPGMYFIRCGDTVKKLVLR